MSMIVQFFPLAVFLGVSKSHGWFLAFQAAGLAALAEFAYLKFRGLPLSRLVGGVNVFLILGGLGFLLQIDFLMSALNELREVGLFICVFGFLLGATLLTEQKAFEGYWGTKNLSLYSWLMVVCSAVCIPAAYHLKSVFLFTGPLLFIFLILVKYVLQYMLYRANRSTAQLSV